MGPSMLMILNFEWKCTGFAPQVDRFCYVTSCKQTDKLDSLRQAVAAKSAD